MPSFYGNGFSDPLQDLVEGLDALGDQLVLGDRLDKDGLGNPLKEQEEHISFEGAGQDKSSANAVHGAVHGEGAVSPESDIHQAEKALLASGLSKDSLGQIAAAVPNFNATNVSDDYSIESTSFSVPQAVINRGQTTTLPK